MKIAVVHDWLVKYAGAERVLEQILLIYPEADVFALFDFLPHSDRVFLQGRKIGTSFLQGLPLARKHYRRYLPLMPLAIEQFDLSAYDVVISSSHAVAKGVITGPDQIHICYVHSPIRYAWDLQHQYLREAGLDHGLRSWLARYMLHRIRLWDVRTAAGVDSFVTNSQFIARRVHKVYRRESTVIYPPVDIHFYVPGITKEPFYLAAGRMVPYKRMPLIVEAFNRMPNKRLVVIGDGPELPKVQRIAKTNISLLGHRPSAELRDYMQRARAFVFAAEEDFGILPVEAQACGTPVIAYGKGGATETVIELDRAPGATGLLFSAQTPESLVDAVFRFESEGGRITAKDCRANAERFSSERFRDDLRSFVGRTVGESRLEP